MKKKDISQPAPLTPKKSWFHVFFGIYHCILPKIVYVVLRLKNTVTFLMYRS